MLQLRSLLLIKWQINILISNDVNIYIKKKNSKSYFRLVGGTWWAAVYGVAQSGTRLKWLSSSSSSLQFSSVPQSCLTLCDPMDCSMPGFPVHHQLPELTHTHVHRVSDAIQPCHPLLSPSPLPLYLSQHQGLFQWVSSLHHVAKAVGA